MNWKEVLTWSSLVFYIMISFTLFSVFVLGVCSSRSGMVHGFGLHRLCGVWPVALLGKSWRSRQLPGVLWHPSEELQQAQVPQVPPNMPPPLPGLEVQGPRLSWEQGVREGGDASFVGFAKDTQFSSASCRSTLSIKKRQIYFNQKKINLQSHQAVLAAVQ